MSFIHSFLILAAITYCNGLSFPKIFMDNMVLQGGPMGANIWGYLEGDLNLVELVMNCNGGHQENIDYSPNEVSLRFLIIT